MITGCFQTILCLTEARKKGQLLMQLPLWL